MMDTENIQAARRIFEGAAASVPGFQRRPGQQRLVDAIAQTLDAADFSEECTAPAPQVLVAEAGTGTGKTLAYVSAALTVAKAKKVKLVISTATVNLMEQLQNKDLPTLAKSFPGGFTFGLAKGRGRYLCLEKLAHRLESSTQASLSLDENDAAQLTPDASSTEPIPLYRKLADMIDSQTWNGERDTLTEEASLAEWTGVAADRVSCTGRQCEHFQACPFYQNKRKLVKSDLIVTNHDLLVASLVHGGGGRCPPRTRQFT